MTIEWLSLQQAAKQLGVHPTTLRRWADKGDIPFMLTPGGHRRFAQEDVDTLRQRQRRWAVGGVVKVWAEKALTRTRAELTASSDARWITAFNEQKRLEQRELGQRLMGLLMQFISNGQNDTLILAEAREIGMASGQNSLDTGLTLTEALQATMFFRDMVVETATQLPRSTRTQPEANLRLLRRINQFMNVVQLAIASRYE